MRTERRSRATYGWLAVGCSIATTAAVERLVVKDAEGRATEYYAPVFASPKGSPRQSPGAKGPALKSKAGNKRKVSDKDIARGIRIAHENGFNWSQAAGTLFDELNPKPSDRQALNLWMDERRRFVDRMRTTLRKAYESKPSH